MRVLFVNQFFYPYLGGVEFHVQHLGVELQRLGCDVTVAYGGPATAARVGAGVPPAPTEFRGMALRPLPGPRALGPLLREGFDVVHAHMPRNAWTLAAAFFARRAGVPSVLTPHCFYPSRDLLWRGLKAAYDASLLRYTFHAVDRVISLTESDRADALARGLPPAKARVVPTSVRTAELAAVPAVDFRAKYGLPWEFLLYVGRFDRVKNVDFLVRAHQRVGGLGLVLVGSDGGTLAAERRRVADLGLADRVRIIERAPFAELCGAYRQARVLVLPSTYEGLGTVLLEALYFGCPVVATAVGGVPYVVRPPVVGCTHAVGDEDAYVAGVEAMLRRGRDEAGIGRAVVEREYAWEVNAGRVLALYRELQTARRAAA
jgi:glycosyltransferase involved in cell wall biosynthesis